MNKLVSLTPAQFRTLKRIAVAHAAPHQWTLLNNAQLRSLRRKGCVAKSGRSWVVSHFGREVLAGKGKARWSDGEYVL